MTRALFIGSFAGLVIVSVLVGTPAVAHEREAVSAFDELGDHPGGHSDRVRANAGTGEGCAVAILFGAFCAVWAQNTGRNPWLWFFMGVIFTCITVLVLLSKNANDLAAKATPPEAPPEPDAVGMDSSEPGAS